MKIEEPFNGDKFQLEETIAKQIELDKLKVQLRESDFKGKCDIIRKAYKLVMPDILSVSEKRRGGKISPYFLDFCNEFTPIENNSWMTIRCLGVPLYPQLPVRNYFLDFGNPFYKIGLEIDGKEFHKDTLKDTMRDEELDSMGWRIFRITGSESNRDYIHPSDLLDEAKDECEDNGDYKKRVEDWIFNTGDGVITSIHNIYFSPNPTSYFGNHPCFPSHEEMLHLYTSSLDKHRLVDFELLESSNQQDQPRLKKLFGIEPDENEI
jgi:very-short-patch-repair endonuclease